MEKFLYFNIIVSAFNVFIIVYAYSLNFFPKKWRKKVNQDTIVGMALIFCTMLTMFSWIVYYYFKIFEPFKDFSFSIWYLKNKFVRKVSTNTS